MARINVEDSWWVSPRRKALIRCLNGNEEEADGAALALWRTAFDYWIDGKKGIPIKVFSLFRLSQQLTDCDLVEVRNEQVFVRGSEDQFSWYLTNIEQKRLAGQSSAKRGRDEKGRLLPKTSSETPTAVGPSLDALEFVGVQQNPTVQPSSSSSSSSSSSKNKSNTEESIGDYLTPIPKQGSSSKLVNGKHSPTLNLDVGRFVGAYVKAYQATYGEATRPDLSGKVLGQIKTFLRDCPIDRACNLIEVYCQMQTPWYKTKCHDFSTFQQNLNPISIALDNGQESNGHLNWNKVWEDQGNGSQSLSK